MPSCYTGVSAFLSNIVDYQHFYDQIPCADNISSIWTSGRKCNFRNKGCDAAQLQPININGWFVPIFTILMIFPIFSIDGWGLYQLHIGKHSRSMFSPCFRFWSDGNKRIPPTNIPSKLTFWSRYVPVKKTLMTKEEKEDEYGG